MGKTSSIGGGLDEGREKTLGSKLILNEKSGEKGTRSGSKRGNGRLDNGRNGQP